jgi:hypothetical protein
MALFSLVTYLLKRKLSRLLPPCSAPSSQMATGLQPWHLCFSIEGQTCRTRKNLQGTLHISFSKGHASGSFVYMLKCTNSNEEYSIIAMIWLSPSKTRAGGMHTAEVITAAEDVQLGSNRCHRGDGASSWERALNASTKLGPSKPRNVEAEEIPEHGCWQRHTHFRSRY